MKQLSLSCLVDLPDDVFAAAELTAKLREPWQQMLAELQQREVKHVHACEQIETRAKPEPGKRGRKPRALASTSAGPDLPT